jgi:hypothetical protein
MSAMANAVVIAPVTVLSNSWSRRPRGFQW